MPTTQRLPPLADTTLIEPVSLAELRAWVRVDSDDTSQDLVLGTVLSAARQKVEAYTGRYFVGGQRLAYTFDLSETYQLPTGATFESVSGFFRTLEELEAWSLEEYRKGISINRQLYCRAALAQTYTVVAALPPDVDCPAIAKVAMLELAGEWFRNRESTTVGTIAPELPVAWRVKLAELRLNPLSAA